MLFKTIERFYDKPLITDLIYPFMYEDDAFLLIDGSLGMIWEIEGMNIDGKSEEEIQKASTTFSNFLKSLPQDIPMQIIAATWRGLEKDALDVYTQGDLRNEHVKEYMQKKVEWHEHGKLHGFAHEGNIHFYPRTIRTYLTVKQKPLFSNGNLYDRQNMKETLTKMKRVEMIVDTSLSSGGIRHRRLGPEDLIAFMYRMLNPDRFLTGMPPRYQGGDLRKYMVFNSPDADQHGWTFEKQKYSVISFGNNPALPDDEGQLHTFPNILFREVNGISLYDYAPMMLFTINFWLPSQDSLNRKLNYKRSMSFLHRFNILGDVSIDKEIAREESRRLLTAMYGGEKIVKASYHICVPSAHEEAEFASAQIVSYLNINTGSNAFKEDLIAPGIFMRCLPFGFDHNVPDEERFVRRAVHAPSAVIADIAPIYISGKGVRTDVACGFYNRRGEGAWLDLFNKDTAGTSPHCLITGATGAGKSVTTGDLISQFLRQPATVFVIDKGESYKRPYELSGGQYLKFEGEPNFILDPFAGDFQDDHRAFLTSLISSMVTGGTEHISREEVSMISEAVLSLVTSAERNMDEIVSTLRSYNDPISTAAARKLFPFHGMGQYARFLEGSKPRLEISNRFTVAELGDLDMYKDLQAVVVFLLIFYITEYVKKIPGRKYLIIDEAWSLFKNEAAVDFLVSATKTFRKYGCAVIFVTQQLEDFMVIARAMNMKDNCPNKILLYQEMDVVTKAAKDLELNQGTLDLYKTIKKSTKYAEALVVAQNWTSVFRITLDPESYWIATTSEPDKVYLNELSERGMTLREAIKQAAQEHPFGVHAASALQQK